MGTCVFLFQIERERVEKRILTLSLYIVHTGRIQRHQLLQKEKELLHPYSLIIKIPTVANTFNLAPISTL